jgi:hypothetical protein
MLPVPVPLTDQFTNVLVRFTTIAVHWEVPRTGTLAGTQETVIVGVVLVAVFDPHDESSARLAATAASSNQPFQRATSHSA